MDFMFIYYNIYQLFHQRELGASSGLTLVQHVATQTRNPACIQLVSVCVCEQVVRKCNEGARTMERTEMMYTINSQLEFKIKVRTLLLKCVIFHSQLKHECSQCTYFPR